MENKSSKASKANKKTNKSKKKKIIRKEAIISVIAIILLVSIILTVRRFVTKINTETLENHSFYQYFAGRKYEYEGTLTLTRKEGITHMQCQDIMIELDSTPIYYQDEENKVLLPEKMSVIYPKVAGKMYKINHFATIYEEDDSIYLKTFLDEKEKDINLENSFLFDGKDLYFFTEDTEIMINGNVYELSPLSYAIVTYNSGIEMYDKKSDSYLILETGDTEIIANIGSYTINLSTDIMKYGNREQLLIKNINHLDNIK